MSKVAVVYWSGTGNTEEMANKVAEGAKAAGAEVEVPELPPITDPDDMELEDEDVVRNIQVNIRLYDGWDE